MATPEITHDKFQSALEPHGRTTPRNPALTRTKARLAALELLRQGKWPSYAAVRAITRRGSASDIKPVLKELFVDLWRSVEKSAATDGEILRADGLSSAVVAAVHTLLDTLRTDATSRYRQEMEAIEARANGARRREIESEQRGAEAQAQTDGLRRELGRVLELRDELKRQIAVERAQRRKLEAANKLLTKQRDLLLGRRRRAVMRSAPPRTKSGKRSVQPITPRKKKTTATSHAKNAPSNRARRHMRPRR